MSNTAPEGWKEKLLKDTVASIISGQSPNRKDHAAKAGKYGILKTTAIDWGKFLPEKNQEVLDNFKVNLKHEVKAGDILITKAGPVHRVGVVTFVPKTPQKILVSGKMTLLRAASGHDPRFLAYALSTEYSQKPLKQSTTGMASSQTNFTHETLLSVPIWVPNALSEQQKIATIMSSVDEMIKKTRTQIEKLKDLKIALMQDLLTKGIGHADFKDSPLGRIPVPWGVVSIAECTTRFYQGINTVADSVTYQSKGVQIIQAKHMTSGYLDLGDARFVSDADYQKYKEKFQPRIGDIIFSNIGTIGKSVIIVEEAPFLIAWNVFLIRVNKYVRPKFMQYFLQHLDWLRFYDNLMTGNATKFVNKSSLGSIQIPVPSDSEQEKIITTLGLLDRRLETSNQKLNLVINLKKALMQDLLTGKVRVNVDQKEPAVA